MLLTLPMTSAQTHNATPHPASFKVMIWSFGALLVCGILAIGSFVFFVTQDGEKTGLATVSVAGVTYQFKAKDIRSTFNKEAEVSEVTVSLDWSPDPTTTGTIVSKLPLIIAPKEKLSIALRKSEGDIDPKDRYSLLYQRFLSPQSFKGVEGLQGQVFSALSPYDGEVLFYDAADPRKFAARCLQGQTTEAQEFCLREIRIENAKLDVVIRFPRAWLEDWKDIDEGVLSALEDAKK